MKKYFALSGIVVVIISVIFFQFGFIKSSTPTTGNPSLTPEPSKKNTEGQLQKLLPEGSLLRDYQKITNVDLEGHLVVYVEPGYSFTKWDLSCPGYVLGEALRGIYHVALFQGGKFVSDVVLPPVEGYYSGKDKFEEVELKYKDIWSNFDPKVDGNIAEDFDMTRISVETLIETKDLTGDGEAYEFLLKTTGGGCGFIDRIAVGYDEETNQVMLLSDWILRFDPDENGESYILFDCGDHGNMTKSEKMYKFNPITKKYEVTWEKETDCELL